MSFGSFSPSCSTVSVIGWPGSPWIMSTASLEAHVLGRFAVDLDDRVAGQDAGLVGGRADHRADDRQLAAVLAVVADLDADAAELALARLLELLEFLRIDVLRVRIEPFEAAVDHVLDELAPLLAVEIGHVRLAHLLQHVHDEGDVFVVLVLQRRSESRKNGQG